MSEHERKTPLDADELELARRFRSLPGGEPPPALDARVRDQAHRAVTTQQPRIRPWVWGASTAAAAVLALGMLWQAGLPPTSEQALFREVPAPAPVGVEPLLQEELEAQHAPEPAPPPPPPPAAAAPAAQAQAPAGTSPARAVVPARRHQSTAETASDPTMREALSRPTEATAPAAAPPLAEPLPSAPIVSPPAGAIEKQSARDTGFDSASADAAPALRAERSQRSDNRLGRPTEDTASGAGLAAKTHPAPVEDDHARVRAADAQTRLGAAYESPHAWVRDIERLLKAGRHDDALASALAFRERHPEHPLPPAVRALLDDAR